MCRGVWLREEKGRPFSRLQFSHSGLRSVTPGPAPELLTGNGTLVISASSLSPSVSPSTDGSRHSTRPACLTMHPWLAVGGPCKHPARLGHRDLGCELGHVLPLRAAPLSPHLPSSGDRSGWHWCLGLPGRMSVISADKVLEQPQLPQGRGPRT